MSIKIKTLKRFFLIFACFTFAGINYMNYVQADTATTSATTTTPTATITDTISTDFQNYLDSKKGQTITLPDLSAFSTQEATTKIGDQNVYATFDDLPQVDKSEIKILPQKYDSLSDDKKQAQIKSDDDTYLTKLAYIILSNLPVSVLSATDLTKLKDSFYNNLTSLNSADNSQAVAYFTDLGNRMDLIMSQTKDFQVPENLVNSYTKALRLTKGIKTLSQDSKNANDPVSQVIILKKVTNLTTLFTGFFQSDVMPFMKSYSASITAAKQ